LLDAIAATARQSPQKSDSGIFRLPIDRVFTIKGFGTVVTGTCIGGKIAVGDEVEILPAGRRTRVRTLQVHGQSVPTAFAGQRTAVNLHGLEVADVDRGAMLAAPDALTPSWMLDVDIEMTRDAPRPLKRRSLVRVHGYTREVMARVVPLNGDTLEPGRGGKAQLRLTEPLVALPGDRFVLRSYSPMTTVGGGLVLNSQPRKHRAPFDDALADLEILRTGDLAARLGVFFRQAGRRGLELRRVAPLLGVGEKTLRDDYQKLLSQRRLVRIDAETESAVAAEAFEEIKRNLLDYLAAYHRDQPTEPGVSRAELLSRPAKGADAKVMGKALAALVGENQVALEGGLARRTGHVVAAGDRLQETLDRLFGLAQQAGVAALTYKEMRDQFEDRELFEQALVMLTRDKRLARVGDALYYEAGALVKAEAMLAGYLAEHGEIDAQGMKTLFDLSRKWTIPLGEYFDAKRVTLRVGDKRVLRRKG
jgi:selenocysteine-specific elongation factor